MILNIFFVFLEVQMLFFVGRAFVFFSSPISRELVTHIKKDTRVITRLGALREVGSFAF